MHHITNKSEILQTIHNALHHGQHVVINKAQCDKLATVELRLQWSTWCDEKPKNGYVQYLGQGVPLFLETSKNCLIINIIIIMVA